MDTYPDGQIKSTLAIPSTLTAAHNEEADSP